MMNAAPMAGCALLIAAAGLVAGSSWLEAADWRQFRGPGGSGVSAEEAVPLEWGDGKNLAWKTELPGPGASSPIVVGERVFVTCYTGYGTARERSADPSALKRHLICVNRKDGKIAWSAAVDAVLPEDSYRGFVSEHGYASSTPVSDGETVFVFFGKSGVAAFDLSGKRLWLTNVGKESDPKRWGSASSLVLYKDLVIVNASSESQSLRGLDKRTGREVWKAEAAGMSLSFGTPTLVELSDGRTELAVAVPGELWGLDPLTGKLLWYASVRLTGNVCPTVAAADGIVYATGGFDSRGTVAFRAGGKGDVTRTHVIWAVRPSSYVPSPLMLHGKLYWVDETGRAVCVDGANGEVLHQERLPLESSGGNNGRPVYASVIAVGDKLVAVTRNSGVVILSASPEMKVLGVNRLNDETDFNATPAVAGGQLFLRSNRALYCVGK